MSFFSRHIWYSLNIFKFCSKVIQVSIYALFRAWLSLCHQHQLCCEACTWESLTLLISTQSVRSHVPPKRLWEILNLETFCVDRKLFRPQRGQEAQEEQDHEQYIWWIDTSVHSDRAWLSWLFTPFQITGVVILAQWAGRVHAHRLTDDRRTALPLGKALSLFIPVICPSWVFGFPLSPSLYIYLLFPLPDEEAMSKVD